MTIRLQLDHLVVAAASLEQGAAWCETRFGVVPAAGGRHAFMGTHNRLLRLSGTRTGDWPDAYLEIIAIDPDAPSPGRPRWFGLDEPQVRASLAASPRLVHWVARAADPEGLRADWAAHGVDPGPVERAERPTPAGLLRWRITIPVDGRPARGGRLPALIAWEGAHPAGRIDPAAGLQLEAVEGPWLPDGVELDGAYAAGHAAARPREDGGTADGAASRLRFRLRGPAGRVELALPDQRAGPA
jgi:hypothetical protein